MYCKLIYIVNLFHMKECNMNFFFFLFKTLFIIIIKNSFTFHTFFSLLFLKKNYSFLTFKVVSSSCYSINIYFLLLFKTFLSLVEIQNFIFLKLLKSYKIQLANPNFLQIQNMIISTLEHFLCFIYKNKLINYSFNQLKYSI